MRVWASRYLHLEHKSQWTRQAEQRLSDKALSIPWDTDLFFPIHISPALGLPPISFFLSFFIPFNTNSLEFIDIAELDDDKRSITAFFVDVRWFALFRQFNSSTARVCCCFLFILFYFFLFLIFFWLTNRITSVTNLFFLLQKGILL